MPAIEVQGDAHWRDLRAQHVGSSEIAALFDVHPWTTRFTLWHVKAGLVPERDRNESRMEVGKAIEPAIASLVGAQLLCDVLPVREYHTHPTVKGLGATLDYMIVDPERGPGIVECKNVDWFEFRRTWGEQPPPYYGLQVQQQYACTQWRWGMLAALVGGNDLRLFRIEPKPRVIAEIERRGADFWQSVRDRRAPEPTGTSEEADVLAELLPNVRKDRVIELVDQDLVQACADWLWGVAQMRTGEAMKTAAQVRILNAMEDAGVALLPGHRAKLSRYPHHASGKIVNKLTIAEADTGLAVPPAEALVFA